ncbi:rho GTPase-activating protein 25-like [Sardina pilchardus]|uniref:rho GTPase-activating protein 25-like n=1 Tax=Sardina pilchardus TaxID=27697 RepID=UPI002E0DE860
MELRTIPLGTRRRASSAFTDPLYDNCLSHSESSDLGVTSALPAPVTVLPAAVPTLRGREDGSGPSGPGSSGWATGGQGWPKLAAEDHDTVSCGSTHESILSLYDNLELPRSPTEDSLDTDRSESASELSEPKDWTDFTWRTENRWMSSCESLEDKSRGAKGQPNKRSGCKPDPFLFTAVESRPKILKVPHPFSSTEPQTQPFVRDIAGDVLHQGTRDLHAPLSLNLPLVPTPYPSSLPAALPPSTSHPEVHVVQQSSQPSSTMTVLLTSIKQQIARQRDEYESQIRRLEQRNEALEAEVLGLRANLEQQRRWYRAVELRLCEVERARADADRRNSELQSQMEQFFDAFGELTNEAKKTERIVQGF